MQGSGAGRVNTVPPHWHRAFPTTHGLLRHAVQPDRPSGADPGISKEIKDGGVTGGVILQNLPLCHFGASLSY